MKKIIGYFTLLLTIIIVSCGGETERLDSTATASGSTDTETASVDPMQNKGIGPVKSVTLHEVNPAMAEEGMEIFNNKCSACHKVEERYIGPALQDVTERRTPEWIMNMILNPEEMTKKDPIAKELLAEYLSPMANQSLEEEEARKILEYFRTL